MINNYDLSVIIPCHNLETVILPLLDSLRKQILADRQVELIFVCDSCTDNTRDVIINYMPFLSQYAAIHIINTSVHKCGLARNEGMKIMTGKYVIFADGDDWYINNKVFLKCINTCEINKSHMLWFAFDKPDDFPFKNQNAMVWQYFFSREIIGDTRFPDIQPDEDVVFTNEMINKIKRDPDKYNFMRTEELMYYYNWGRPGSNMMIWAAEEFKKMQEKEEKLNGRNNIPREGSDAT